jgi:hypothetical protein
MTKSRQSLGFPKTAAATDFGHPYWMSAPRKPSNPIAHYGGNA